MEPSEQPQATQPPNRGERETELRAEPSVRGILLTLDRFSARRRRRFPSEDPDRRSPPRGGQLRSRAA
eukprot:747296-Hanusia_phi.AAC.4